jgi:hypothetical protein
MPLVTAAGYPSQNVPTVSPSPTPGADYQDIRSSPDAFGAAVGRSESHLGETFGQAGNQFEAVALEQQRLTNQVAADNAANYTMNQAQTILHGDPNVPGDVGYFGKQGNDAVNGRKDAWDNLNKSINDARAKLTNQRQMLEFDRQTQRMRGIWQGQIGAHYDQQLRVAAHGAAVAQQQLGLQGMASSAANLDEQAFNANVEQAMRAGINAVKVRGGGQEEIDLELNKVRAQATRTWAQSMSQKDPLGADQFLEHNKDALLPGEYDTLKREFRARAEKQQATQDVYGVPQGQKRVDPNLIKGGAASGNMSLGDMKAAAVRAGFTGSAVDIMAATAMAESGGNPNAANEIGEHSYGITQINADAHGPEAKEALGNPDKAMQLAYRISKGGTDFSPWTMYRNGSYQQYMTAGHASATANNDTGLRAEYDAAVARRKANPERNTGPRGSGQEANLGMESFEDWRARVHPVTTVELASATGATPSAKPLDTLVNRPLPPREPEEIPDQQVPGLAQKIQDLAQKIPVDDPDRFARAVKLLRQDANRDYADQQHQLKLKQEADKANDEKLTLDYYRKLGTPGGPTTAQVLADTRFRTPEAVKNVVGFIERENKQDPAAEVSKNNTRNFYSRMTAPEDDPTKLRNMQEVHSAYTAGDITRQDHDWLISQNDKLAKEGDESFKEFKARKIRSVQNQILGTSAFLPQGEQRPADLARMQDYLDAVDAKIEEYNGTNKNKRDLFDPKKPGNVVDKEFLKEFAPKVGEAVRTGGALDLSTPDKVGAALRANRISYDAAVKALEAQGIPHESRGQPAAVQ